MDEVVKQIVTSVVAALVPAILGQWGLAKAHTDGKPSDKQVYALRAISLLIGVLVFAFWRWDHASSAPKPSETTTPVLQSIEAEPNPANISDNVELIVHLNRPAAEGGASIYVESSDERVLAMNGNIRIPEGGTTGYASSQVLGIPPNGLPVTIQASYNGKLSQANINVRGRSFTVPPIRVAEKPATRPVSPTTTSVPVRLSAPSSSAVTVTPPKPPPLDAELASRFEEAQAQLTAEENFWDGVKQHMPPGTSLRPEITSQIFAARSTSQRCAKARDASEAASLSSCIDALNDHLTQLKIQH